MAMDFFQAAPVIINTANTLSGMTKAGYKPNITKIKPAHDGRAVRCIITEGTVQPAVELVTLNCGQALLLLSASGSLPYLALSSLKWYDRKVDTAGPIFAAGTVHEQGAATSGVLFFTGLDGVQNKEAVMTLTALLTSADGDTHPVTWTQVAAPTDPNTVAPWVVDTVTIDGTAVDQIESVSIRAAVSAQIENGMKVYPRLARPRFVDWSITVKHNDATLKRLKTDKSAAIAVTFKLLNSGGPTRGATVLTVTVTGTLTFEDQDQTGEAGNNGMTHMVEGRHDGTNQPATWSVV